MSALLSASPGCSGQGGEKEAPSSLLGAWLQGCCVHLPMDPAALQIEASKQGLPRVLLGRSACRSLSPGPLAPRAAVASAVFRASRSHHLGRGRGCSGPLPAWALPTERRNIRRTCRKQIPADWISWMAGRYHQSG